MTTPLIDLSEKRLFTARQVIRPLLEQGPKSRAELSRHTGMSRQTVSKAIDSLKLGGWVEQVEVRRVGIGGQATHYKVNGSSAFALAIDLGGTKIDGVLVNLAGQVVGKHRMETSALGGSVVIDQISQMADFLFKESKNERSKLRTCVVGVPGVPDPMNGTVRLAPNMEGWDRLDVKNALHEALGCTVVLENDVNLAALGELHFGAGRALSNFGFLNLGTGVGMGLILDKRLVRGETGAAGEIGFLPLAPGSESSCNMPAGPLEHSVGSHGLLTRYNINSNKKAKDVSEIFARARRHEGAARGALEEAGSLFAFALLSVAACVDVRDFVLGGSIGMQDLLIENIESSLCEDGADGISVRKSHLANRAGTFGALHQAIRHLAEDIFQFGSSGDCPTTYANDFEKSLTGSWNEIPSSNPALTPSPGAKTDTT